MTKLVQTLLDGLAVGGLYALIALGYTMVYGILKFINFAHSDVFVLGAWISWVFAVRILGVPDSAGATAPGWTGPLVLVVAMAACGTAGFLIERFAYKPLRGAPRLNVLITAIGVSLLLENTGQLRVFFGPYPKSMPRLVPDITLGYLAGVRVLLVDVIVLGTALVFMLGLEGLIYRTKLGRGMRAVSFNTSLASLMGVNVNAVISFTFVLGSALAAAAGFLFVMKYPAGLKQPADTSWLMLGLKAFVAAVVGGIGNVRGAMLGGVLIGLLEFFGVAYLEPLYRDVYVFSLLILVLLFRPTGLLGQATVEKSVSLPAGTFWRNFAPLAVGLALASILHFWIQPASGAFATKVLLDIGINVILAVSLTLVNGFTGQFSIGHAGFMCVGGYVAAAVTYYGSHRLYGDAFLHGGVLSWTAGQGGVAGPLLAGGDVLFVVACLLGGLAAAVAGYVVGLPSLRLRGDYLAIVTLGFGEIVRVLFQSTQPQLFAAGEIQGVPAWHLTVMLGGALGFTSVPFYSTLFWVYAFVALTLLATYRIKQSGYGRAFLAIREDEVAAEAMGVHTTRLKVRAFVLSSFFAGLAGALFAHSIGSINAGELGFQKSFDVIIMVVLGGMGSISGSTLAAVILTILPELLRTATEHVNRYLPEAYALPDLRMIIYSLALIVMMIVRPQGLFGLNEIWDVLRLRRSR